MPAFQGSQERLAFVLCGGAVALLLQQLWVYAQRPRLSRAHRRCEEEEKEEDDSAKPPTALRRVPLRPPPETGFADQFIRGLQQAIAGPAPGSPARASRTGVPPKVALSRLAAAPELADEANGASSEAAAAAANLAGCNLVGWGNNEDGQLVPAGPAHSGNQTEVLPPTAPGMSPRLVAHPATRAVRLPSDQPPLKSDTYALPSPLQFLPPGRRVVGVSCGSRHTLAVTADGLVFAWGWAALGQLGEAPAEMSPRGGSLNSLDRRAPSGGGGSSDEASCRPIEVLANAREVEGLCVEVSAGGMHSACRFASGHVYTWGMSTFGQLGRGGLAAAAATSVRQPGLVCLPDEGGGNDAAAAAQGPGARGGGGSSSSSSKWREPQPGQALVTSSVSCGGMHTCCVGAAGELYAWGRADQGQLGLGRNWMRRAPAGGAGGAGSSPEAPHQDFKGVCWPTRVQAFEASDDPVIQVSCGGFHTAAVTAGGALFCWGREEWGCLGIHFTGDRLVSGVYLPQQVELPAGSRRVAAVSCGGSHTLAVDDQRRALCCGKNEHGRLGLGPGAWKNKLTFEVVPSLQGEVVAVAAGGSHSLFVTADGALWACGRTSLGRLGLPEAALAAPDLPGASAGAAAKAAAAQAVDDDNRGLGTPHRLAPAPPPLRPAAVSAGGQHSCVVFN